MTGRDELLHYYERELDFIRRLALEFSQRHPEMAGRLELVAGKSTDPHVERLIEAFALLTARIRVRLDDDFAEVSDALLGILYPHYLAPIPSLTTVQLTADADAAKAKGGLPIERGAMLFSKPTAGIRCRFRTAYPVTLWPVEVESTELVTATSVGAPVPAEARSALRIRLRAQGGATFPELGLDRLRFFLDNAGSAHHALYDLLLRDPVGLVVSGGPGGTTRVLRADAVRPVGFGRDEGLLAYPDTAFLGYRLLQEYFAYPEKFMFVELAGLEGSAAPDGDLLEVSVLLRESLQEIAVNVRPENLRLGCTPAVNLFEMTADPIQVTHTQIEYPVTPDVRNPRAYEVCALRSVSTIERGTGRSQAYEPIFTLRHGASAAGQAYWYAARRPALRKDDPGTDVFVSLVDEKLNLLKAPTEVLHVDALCSNRDLPSLLTFGDARGDFDVQGRPGVRRVVCLRKPTEPVRSPLGRGARWRLISHLALNHLSLGARDSEPRAKAEALAALREILKLYDFTDSPGTRQRIAGLTGLQARPAVRRIGRGANAGFARGTEVELQLDPDQFSGQSVLLFASVLEVFLGLYTAANSFTQTTARLRQGDRWHKRWPPRAGEMQLL